MKNKRLTNKERKALWKEKERDKRAWYANGIVNGCLCALTVCVVLMLCMCLVRMGPEIAAAEAPTANSLDKAAAPVQLTEQEPQTETVEECLAKLIWGEARGCSIMEQAAVVWCVLNRVDSDEAYYPDEIIAVVHQKNQFSGYRADNPVLQEHVALAHDVLARWEIEAACVGDVGRVLPKEYLFFDGDGEQNHFRTEYTGGEVWDWDCTNPYVEEQTK